MACFTRVANYTAATEQRLGHTAVVFNNRAVIIGGIDGVGAYNGSVYHAQNGYDFSRVAQGANNIIPTRAFHAAVVHDNRIYVTGGQSAMGAALSDVWSSVDGQTFTRIANNAFPARYAHQMYSFDNRLWVVGGYNGNINLPDCWCSWDGSSWTKIVDNYAIIARDAAAHCVYDNRMWRCGGMDTAGTPQREVYFSANGREWQAAEIPPDFPALQGATLTVFDEKMVLIGGDTSGRGTASVSTLWYSKHGSSWVLGCNNIGFACCDHAAVALKEPHRIFVYGGWNGQNVFGHIWMTAGCEFLDRAY